MYAWQYFDQNTENDLLFGVEMHLSITRICIIMSCVYGGRMSGDGGVRNFAPPTLAGSHLTAACVRCSRDTDYLCAHGRDDLGGHIYAANGRT